MTVNNDGMDAVAAPVVGHGRYAKIHDTEVVVTMRERDPRPPLAWLSRQYAAAMAEGAKVTCQSTVMKGPTSHRSC